jgi:chromate transport protein ChrA
MHVLSIPTWIIHTSSVLEWVAAIWLIWQYGEIKQNPAWQGLAWGMLPALISAMCACTWHYFDNDPHLEWLVTVQATFTLIGNVTLWAAAWWLLRSSQPPSKDSDNIL